MMRPEQAIASYQRALAMLAQHMGADHPSVATTHGNLGDAFRSLGRHDEAIVHYSHELDIELRTSSDDSTVATTFINLGQAYSAQGSHEQAVKMLTRALQIEQRSGVPSALAQVLPR